jgi:polysaccharide biosynthesis transport protein
LVPRGHSPPDDFGFRGYRRLGELMNAASNSDVVRTASNSVPFTVPGRRPEPLASVRGHYWLALLTGSLLLIAGLAAALIYGQHQYEAEAQVEVSPTFPAAVQTGALPFNSDVEYHEFVQQQVAEIASYATTSAALNLLGGDRRLWQAPDESNRKAAERLASELEVNPILGTYLVSVSLTGREPEGLARIVNAVVSAYLQREQHRELEESDQRTQLLVQHRAALDKEIEKLRAQEAQLAQELGVSGFSASFVSPYDKILSDANAALDSAHQATIKAQAHLDALNAEEQRLDSLEVDSTAEQMVSSDAEVNEARAELAKEREEKFLQLQQLGPDHPGRPALQAEMDDIDDELARLSSGRADQLSAILRQARRTEAQRQVSEAESKVDQAQRTQDGIQKLVEDLRARAASLGAKYREGVTTDANLARDTSEIQQIDEQIGLLRIQTQSPGFVSVESRALIPDIPLKGTRRKILVIFLAGALVLTIGLPTGLDMVDPLIKTPDELEAIVGFPPFGAMLGSQGRAAREALRAIALGIIRECRTSSIRSFVLTPVSEGTVCRTLALALAQELNQLGIRTVALESSDFNKKLSWGGIHGSATPPPTDENPIPPPNQGEVRWGASEASIFRAAENSANNSGSDHGAESRKIQSEPRSYLATAGDRPTPASAESHHRPGARESRVQFISPATDRASDAHDEEKDGTPASDGHNGAGTRPQGNEAPAVMGLGLFPPTSAEAQANPTLPAMGREREGQDSTLMPAPVRGLLDKLRNRYDVLLFEAPPILASADAEMLLQMPAGAILVIRAGHDVPRDVKASARRLERIAPPVVGTVMTYVSETERVGYSPQAIVRRWLAAR